LKQYWQYAVSPDSTGKRYCRVQAVFSPADPENDDFLKTRSEKTPLPVKAQRPP